MKIMSKKDRRKKTDDKIDDSWLLPYADMLTLLLALFVILFAMSEVDSQKYKDLSSFFKGEFSSSSGILENSPSSIDSQMTNENVKDKEKDKDKDAENKPIHYGEFMELNTAINEYIKENNLSEVIGTQLTDEGLLITILNEITFDSGSATVKKEGIKVGREVSKFLHSEPPHQIVISGHADDRPIHNAEFGSNWELSVMRSINFMTLLLENEKLDPTMLSAKGFGEYQPIVPN